MEFNVSLVEMNFFHDGDITHLVVSARKNDSMRSSRVWSRTSFTVAYPQSVLAEY